MTALSARRICGAFGRPCVNRRDELRSPAVPFPSVEGWRVVTRRGGRRPTSPPLLKGGGPPAGRWRDSTSNPVPLSAARLHRRPLTPRHFDPKDCFLRGGFVPANPPPNPQTGRLLAYVHVHLYRLCFNFYIVIALLDIRLVFQQNFACEILLNAPDPGVLVLLTPSPKPGPLYR